MASTVNVGVIFYALFAPASGTPQTTACQGSGLRLWGLSCENVLG